MTGDRIVDLSAERDARHEAVPRDGEGLYRYGIRVGSAGGREPMRHHYPMTTICECGRTIERLNPDDEWTHKKW